MQTNNLLDKLVKVERTINIYANVDQKLIEEINIDIPIETLRNIVHPKNGDDLLYMAYVLDASQLDELNRLNNIIKPDFDKYYYVLECTGIYNW